MTYKPTLSASGMAGSPHVKETTAAPPPQAVFIKADLTASLLLRLSKGNGLKSIGILKADASSREQKCLYWIKKDKKQEFLLSFRTCLCQNFLFSFKTCLFFLECQREERSRSAKQAVFSTPLLFIALLRGGKALSCADDEMLLLWPGTVLLGSASGAAPWPTGSSSTDSGQPAAALMTDRILAIAPSSFLVLPHHRNGGERWNLKGVIKKQQLPWDRVGGEDRRTSSITRM